MRDAISPAGRRPIALVVISSSCQLYSGTGTVLFDWIRFARQAIAFTLLIDTADFRNVGIALRFCETTGTELLLSAPNPTPGCPDFGVRDVARIMGGRPWDIVECHSWANAATNLDVLSSLRPGSRLIFTPYTQPIWTQRDGQQFFMVRPVLRRMLETADATILLSPNELADWNLDDGIMRRAQFIPGGVDTATFSHTDKPITRNVLCVCDFAERRKRADLLFAAVARAAQRDPGLRLIIAGSGSTTTEVPAHIRDRVTALGYVSRERLVREYRTAGVLALLSDYEAFGLPIAEALCCGAPVLINHQPQLERIFADLPGVSIVTNTDTAAVADALLWQLDEPLNRRLIAARAAERFALQATYGRKLAHVLALCGCGEAAA